MKIILSSLLLIGSYFVHSPSSFAVVQSSIKLSELTEQSEYSARSAYDLGLAYLHGKDGVEKDLYQAVQLFERLAYDNGIGEISTKSAYILAVLNTGKYNHEKDLKKAQFYFSIASDYSSENLYPDAPYHYAMLTQNDTEYIKALEKSALLGYVPAMLELANAHNTSERIKGNINAMVRWLRMAADNNHVPAQAVLGRMYFKGDHVYQDYKRAFKYLSKAAEQGNSDAQASLGLIYKLGLDKPIDLKKARHWFRESYTAGNLDAGENYAGILLNSPNEDDVRNGINVLKEIGEQGIRSALLKLVSIYQEGKLVDKNAKLLAHWQKLYAESGEDTTGIIGLNQSEQGDTIVFTTSAEAVELHKKGWQLLKEGKYQNAIPLLEQAALLDLPIAQLDLAIALIQKAQTEDDTDSYLTAFAWVKVAANNKQAKADELLANMQDSFDLDMLENGMAQYKAIKGKVKVD